MTNIRIDKEKIITNRCKFCKIHIGGFEYKRVEFIQNNENTIQWFRYDDEISDREEKDLENIYHKFKNTKL